MAFRPDGLTDRQWRFIEEYVVDQNGTRSAIAAGYSAKTATVIASEMLTKPKVRSVIDDELAKKAKATGITAERVLMELARVAFVDIRKLYNDDGSLKAPHDLDDDTAAALSSVETVEEFAGRGDERELVGYTKKAKLYDKVSALTLSMRHLGMLKDKVEHSGPNGAPIAVAQLTQAEFTAAARAILQDV